MKSRNFANALLTSAIVLGCGVGVANAADAPKDNKGFTASKTTVVDLGPEIEGMAGRQLRLRLLTLNRADTSGCTVTKIGPPSFIS